MEKLLTLVLKLTSHLVMLYISIIFHVAAKFAELVINVLTMIFSGPAHPPAEKRVRQDWSAGPSHHLGNRPETHRKRRKHYSSRDF